jgi:hypothetical protein
MRDSLSQADKKIILGNFFRLYNQFLDIDAHIALTGVGRNRYIINNFLELFTLLHKKDKANFNRKLKDVSTDLLKYKSKYKKYEKICTEVSYNQEYQIFDTTISPILSNGFKKFYDASELYYIHRKELTDEDMVKIYIKSNESYQISYFGKPIFGFEEFLRKQIKSNEYKIVKIAVLKQSLMEFNNALSHLNSAFFNREPDANIKRAAAHIERGALDFYKAIIRDRMFLEKFSEKDTEAIRLIRCKEYGLIGKNDRGILFDEYKKMLSSHLVKK